MKNLIKILTIDFISFLFVILIPISLYYLASFQSDQLGLPESVFDLSEQQLESAAVALQNYFLFFIALIALALLIIILIWGISRALIWRLTISQKITLKYILRSILLALKWFPMGLVPALIIIVTLKDKISTYALVIYLSIFTYLSMYLYLSYAKTGNTKILKNLKGSIQNTKLLLVFIIIALVYFVLATILNFILSKTINISWLFITVGVINAIIYLIFFAVSRFIFVKKRG